MPMTRADAELHIRSAAVGNARSMEAILRALVDGDFHPPTGPVNVTDAATYTIEAANSGKLHVMPDLTADCTIDLPTPASGMNFTFMFGGAAADAQDWIFDTGSNTNFFIGGVMHVDADAGAAADETIPVFPDGNSNSILTVLTPSAGTILHFWSDDTNWYVNGTVVSASASAAAFTDQA